MLESYIAGMMRMWKPISMEKVLKLVQQGHRVDGQSLAYIFKDINEDQACSTAKILKSNKFQMNSIAYVDICLSAPSLQTALDVAEIFEVGSGVVTAMNLPFLNFLQCFLHNPEDLGKRLEFLVSQGLPLSAIETFILGHLGLHVSPMASRDLPVFEMGRALELIRDQEFCCAPVLIDMVVGRISEQSRKQQLQDFSWLYEIVKDTNGEWLQAIINTGLDFDHEMLLGAIWSGEECNLLSVLSVMDESIISLKPALFFLHFNTVNIKDESVPFQELFQKLLESIKLIPNSPTSTDMLEFVLSRPSFMKILYKHSPQFLGDSAKFEVADRIFVSSLRNGFEAPDLYLEYSGQELGSWFAFCLCNAYDPNSITAGLQYLIYHGKLEWPDSNNITPLYVVASRLEILPVDEALFFAQAFISAGANVNVKCHGETPLDIVLEQVQSPAQLKMLSLLIKAGASFDHVVGPKNHRLIRMALWDTSIRFILEGLKDSGSSLYEDMNGLDVGELFSRAILGFDQ